MHFPDRQFLSQGLEGAEASVLSTRKNITHNNKYLLTSCSPELVHDVLCLRKSNSVLRFPPSIFLLCGGRQAGSKQGLLMGLEAKPSLCFRGTQTVSISWGDPFRNWSGKFWHNLHRGLRERVNSNIPIIGEWKMPSCSRRKQIFTFTGIKWWLASLCFEQKEFPTLPHVVTGGKSSVEHNTAKRLEAAHCPLKQKSRGQDITTFTGSYSRSSISYKILRSAAILTRKHPSNRAVDYLRLWHRAVRLLFASMSAEGQKPRPIPK